MTKPVEQNQQETKGDQNERGFGIQRIYIKDLSLEVPNSPSIFSDTWEPEMHVDLGTDVAKLDDQHQEVTLSMTVTVKLKEKVAFLVEIKQAGIFFIKGFAEKEKRQVCGVVCPNVLFPYAQAAMTDAVMRAGFPQMYLSPINFQSLFDRHERERQESSH